MNTVKRVAMDLLAIVIFAIALFVLGTAIKEEEWLLAVVVTGGLFLGTRGSAAICGRSTQTVGLTRSAMPSQGFAPIADERAKVLVLGTLPGMASLNAGEYYAHPRNGFWRIMGELFKWPPDMSYRERTNRLVSAGVALWDVCEAAHRPGSLDTAIETTSVLANDFETFFREHPCVRLICFNGTKAANLYLRAVHPELPESLKSIPCETLPSTSPANASIRHSDKLSRWSIVKEACET